MACLGTIIYGTKISQMLIVVEILSRVHKHVTQCSLSYDAAHIPLDAVH